VLAIRDPTDDKHASYSHKPCTVLCIARFVALVSLPWFTKKQDVNRKASSLEPDDRKSYKSTLCIVTFFRSLTKALPQSQVNGARVHKQ
jgi:hypothetical protein